jgi:hypothetical protein
MRQQHPQVAAAMITLFSLIGQFNVDKQRIHGDLRPALGTVSSLQSTSAGFAILSSRSILQASVKLKN